MKYFSYTLFLIQTSLLGCSISIEEKCLNLNYGTEDIHTSCGMQRDIMMGRWSLLDFLVWLNHSFQRRFTPKRSNQNFFVCLFCDPGIDWYIFNIAAFRRWYHPVCLFSLVFYCRWISIGLRAHQRCGVWCIRKHCWLVVSSFTQCRKNPLCIVFYERSNLILIELSSCQKTLKQDITRICSQPGD